MTPPWPSRRAEAPSAQRPIRPRDLAQEIDFLPVEELFDQEETVGVEASEEVVGHAEFHDSSLTFKFVVLLSPIDGRGILGSQSYFYGKSVAYNKVGSVGAEDGSC